MLEHIVWEPALVDGRFEEQTAYTAHVTLRANRGGLFSDTASYSIALNAQVVPAVYDEESMGITASISFPVTESYEVFEASISGPEEIPVKGRTVTYTFVTDKALSDTTAVWSVDDETIASIDPNGRLHPILDGTVTHVTVGDKDVDVYAVWGKGIVWDFENSNPYIIGIASGKMYTDGMSLVCETSESRHDVRLTTINPGLDPRVYQTIVIRMAAEAPSNFHLYYKSEYADDKNVLHTVGYNVNKDGSSGYSYAEALSGNAVYTASGLDSFFTLRIPMNKTGDVGTWGNESAKKIVGLWFDPFDDYGKKCRIDYIAFLDGR